jgi:hypothetical protein
MAHIHGATVKTLSHGAQAGHGVAMATAKHAGAAIGIAAATQTHSGKGLMSVFSKHPFLVFTLGVATGYFAHKYRKEIIASATRATELGKDFVMHQKENLEDLVAECQECPEDGEKE